MNLQNLEDIFKSRCSPGIGYTKKYLTNIFTEVTNGRYSVTYTNRRLKSLTVNIGDAGMKNVPIFERHNNRYYLVGSYQNNKKSLF